MTEASAFMDWLSDQGPWALIGYAAALVLAVQRGMDAFERVARALERIGKAPDRVREWLEHRAERIVTAERERDALPLLVSNSERLLAQLDNNGGSTFKDAIDARFDSVGEALSRIEIGGAARFDAVERKLDAHLAEQPPHLAEHNDAITRIRILEQRVGRLDGLS